MFAPSYFATLLVLVHLTTSVAAANSASSGDTFALVFFSITIPGIVGVFLVKGIMHICARDTRDMDLPSHLLFNLRTGQTEMLSYA